MIYDNNIFYKTVDGHDVSSAHQYDYKCIGCLDVSKMAFFFLLQVYLIQRLTRYEFDSESINII